MRKLAFLIAFLALLTSMSGCGEKQDISDVRGTWHSAEGDNSTVVFNKNGSVIIEGYNAGVGIYTYNPEEVTASS